MTLLTFVLSVVGFLSFRSIIEWVEIETSLRALSLHATALQSAIEVGTAGECSRALRINEIPARVAIGDVAIHLPNHELIEHVHSLIRQAGHVVARAAVNAEIEGARDEMQI